MQRVRTKALLRTEFNSNWQIENEQKPKLYPLAERTKQNLNLMQYTSPAYRTATFIIFMGGCMNFTIYFAC